MIVQQRTNVVVSLALTFVVIGALAVYVLRETATYFVERQAVEVANMVVNLAKTARSVYSDEVVKKLKADGVGAKVDYAQHSGYVPIPAQFLKYLGQASTKNTSELFYYKPVSKWNLEPTQGLTDDFLRWAWPQLESQDMAAPTGPIPWKPVWRIEQEGSQKVLRYLAADAAATQLCVDCHNTQEASAFVTAMRKVDGVPTGKQWKQHQLLGALSVTVPLERIEVMAGEQIKRASLSLGAVLLVCMLFITWSVLRGAKQERKAASLSRELGRDQLTQLLNKRGFDESLGEYLASAKEEQKNHALMVMELVDLDAIEDAHGRQAADKLLQNLAGLVAGIVGENGTAARIGEKEFAVILPNYPIYKANGVAISIRNAIQELSVDWQGTPLSSAVSIGMVKMDAKTGTAAQALEAAAAACDQSKKKSNNQIVISDS